MSPSLPAAAEVAAGSTPQTPLAARITPLAASAGLSTPRLQRPASPTSSLSPERSPGKWRRLRPGVPAGVKVALHHPPSQSPIQALPPGANLPCNQPGPVALPSKNAPYLPSIWVVVPQWTQQGQHFSPGALQAVFRDYLEDTPFVRVGQAIGPISLSFPVDCHSPQ